MAIDIRADVTCSLGPVISATISDDYVQNNGLIKVRGSCEIADIITPALGSIVTFSYTKNGVTTQIPRTLRVLSSFADPFRRTTKVELGCKLTYLQDLKESLTWNVYNFEQPPGIVFLPINNDLATVQIYASAIMTFALGKLGITASSNPLTNQFTTGSFSFYEGYVTVLGNLLLSESYCGYLDANEVLQVFSLDQSGGTGPVLNNTNIIDIGNIGVGQIPGDAVIVSYSTLKLNKTLSTTTPAWDSFTSSSVYPVSVGYEHTNTAGNKEFAVRTWNILERTTTLNHYKVITIVDDQGPKDIAVKDYVQTYFTTQFAAVAGGIISEYLSNNIYFNNSGISKTTIETFAYDDRGNEIQYIKYVKGSFGFIVGGLGLQFVNTPDDYVIPNVGKSITLEAEIRNSYVAGNYKKVYTYNYGPWSQTIQGQQAIAACRNTFNNATQTSDFINSFSGITTQSVNAGLFEGLTLIDSKVTDELVTVSRYSVDGNQIINASNANGGNPNNNWRTDKIEQLVVASGSPLAERRVEFSMPYAPDDTYWKWSGVAVISVTSSDAPAKAQRFGLVQNKILLGNRYGMSIQVAPETLPSAPYSPLMVQANGYTALYRTNGTNWTMSKDGVVVGTDALFWGGVGTS